MGQLMVISVSSEHEVLGKVVNLAVDAEAMSVHGEHLVEEHEKHIAG